MSRKPFNPIYAFLRHCVVTPSGCWEWKGKINTATGYANFDANNKFYTGHKFSYEYFVKPVSGKNIVHHLCENKTCCNPEHLKEITYKEHTRKHDTPCGINSRKTHCNHGHKLTETNTYITPNGRRQCRICNTARQKKFRDSHY